MSKICLEHGSSIYIRDVLKALNAIVAEATLEFDEESVRVLAMDPSHIAMIDLELPYSAFDRYDVYEPVKLCLNLEDVLKKVFKKTYKDEALKLEFDPEEDTKATFTLITDVERVKKVPVLEPTEEEVPSPKIYFKSSARLISKTVKTKIVDDMYSEYNHMKIEADRDAITFSVKGDYGEERVTLDRYNDNVLDLESEEPSKAVYTMSYLPAFFKGIVPLSSVVNLELATDMPLKISAELPDGKLAYYLAPCVGVQEKEEEQPKEEEVKDPLEFTTVKMLQDTPQIVGVDLKEYGPYVAGDKARIPKKTAENLIKRGVARTLIEEEIEEVQIRESEPLVEPEEKESVPVIESVPEVPAVPDPLTGDQLRHALRAYYMDNPGEIERPPDAVLRQYLEA